MIEYEQLIPHHNEAEGMIGDCWRTCIACILEMPPNLVPHFMRDAKDEPQSDWWRWSRDFVVMHSDGRYNLFWSELTKNGGTPAPTRTMYVEIDGGGTKGVAHRYAILTGKSPRTEWDHCVVWDVQQGEVVWDPHPDGNGELLSHNDIVYFVEGGW